MCCTDFSDNEKECIIVWEKKPTVEEKAKADTLKLPPTFFCGVCSDTDEDNGNGEDFQSELQKVQEAQVRISLINFPFSSIAFVDAVNFRMFLLVYF